MLCTLHVYFDVLSNFQVAHFLKSVQYLCSLWHADQTVTMPVPTASSTPTHTPTVSCRLFVLQCLFHLIGMLLLPRALRGYITPPPAPVIPSQTHLTPPTQHPADPQHAEQAASGHATDAKGGCMNGACVYRAVHLPFHGHGGLC